MTNNIKELATATRFVFRLCNRPRDCYLQNFHYKVFVNDYDRFEFSPSDDKLRKQAMFRNTKRNGQVLAVKACGVSAELLCREWVKWFCKNESKPIITFE